MTPSNSYVINKFGLDFLSWYEGEFGPLSAHILEPLETEIQAAAEYDRLNSKTLPAFTDLKPTPLISGSADVKKKELAMCKKKKDTASKRGQRGRGRLRNQRNAQMIARETLLANPVHFTVRLEDNQQIANLIRLRLVPITSS